MFLESNCKFRASQLGLSIVQRSSNLSIVLLNNYVMPPLKLFIVTGTFHGSWISARTEGEARRLFHTYYNGESIIHLKCHEVNKDIFSEENLG